MQRSSSRASRAGRLRLALVAAVLGGALSIAALPADAPADPSGAQVEAEASLRLPGSALVAQQWSWVR